MLHKTQSIIFNLCVYVFNYIYQYKDHLGNIRLSYQDKDNNATVNSSEIIQEENYYPFSLSHKGYNGVIVGIDNKYKYNGKELQDETIGGNQLNLYDYGARNYDPALGRWMNIDPLAEKSRRFNPYTYALDNPVYFIDPDGMEAISPIYDPSGNFLGTDEDGLKGEAVVMKKKDFKQGMSKEDAESKNLGQEGFEDDKATNKAFNHFSKLKDRPDYDGKLTLKEANEWFRKGGGEPLL
ncbi:RHS repeat domain-containing protein [Flavobacterium sp. 140616W15]|uniref:RHS repeat domain-containing protein n=1 Tax=Flavobacterium sp. 140616W15 TaxID=2478552 RepID=UPI000F0BF715|nr:RHS repeat-associated core domain-containing protein [Flavobacterium sp. 140616W15]AYN04566.1 RHS repeat-associated core domain-containing protein [Flavobacterium sp. 140616W15]